MGEWVRWDIGSTVRLAQIPLGLGSRGWTEVTGDFRDKGCTTLWLAASHFPRGLGLLPHLYIPTLLSLPAYFQPLPSFPLPLLKISLRERT